jgi:membrane protein
MKLIEFIKKFFLKDIWKPKLHKLPKWQALPLKYLRVIVVSIKGFIEDKCVINASALTYFTLLSIVPVLAMIFAIAKGLGYQKKLQTQLLEEFGQQSAVLTQIFKFANTLLDNTKGGVIAGVGVVVLLYSVMKLLSNIEDAFNDIWEIKKARSIFRKFSDYTSIVILSPLLIILSGSITVIFKSSVNEVVSNVHTLSFLSPAKELGFKAISVFLVWIVFTFIYMIVPNTKVKFKSAFVAGIITGSIFQLVQWAYVSFQIGVASNNAIYGSFAALPLFLIWLQISWYIILTGAEISFSHQNIEHMEYEHESQLISSRLRKSVAILIAKCATTYYIEEHKPITAQHIANKLEIPIRIVRNILNDFVACNICIETKMNNDKDTGYVPSSIDETFTIKTIIDKLDNKGINEIPMQHTTHWEDIEKKLSEMDQLVYASAYNTPIKDIQ